MWAHNTLIAFMGGKLSGNMLHIHVISWHITFLRGKLSGNMLHMLFHDTLPFWEENYQEICFIFMSFHDTLPLWEENYQEICFIFMLFHDTLPLWAENCQEICFIFMLFHDTLPFWEENYQEICFIFMLVHDTLTLSCLWEENYQEIWFIYVTSWHIAFMKGHIGLNIFYSEEKDWVWHTTRQCPLQNMTHCLYERKTIRKYASYSFPLWEENLNTTSTGLKGLFSWHILLFFAAAAADDDHDDDEVYLCPWIHYNCLALGLICFNKTNSCKGR